MIYHIMAHNIRRCVTPGNCIRHGGDDKENKSDQLLSTDHRKLIPKQSQFGQGRIFGGVSGLWRLPSSDSSIMAT